MKAVERYRAELDSIQAPDALKEKLRAIPTQYPQPDTLRDSDCFENIRKTLGATDTKDTSDSYFHPRIPFEAEETPERTSKKWLYFPQVKRWHKQAIAAVACFAIGVFATDALGWQVIPRMGGMDDATTATGSARPTSPNEIMPEIAMDTGESSKVEFSDSAAPMSSDSTVLTRDSNATRKIIYTTTMNLETKAYDDTLVALTTALDEVGGYLEFSESHTRNNEERYGEYTYRIPATEYAAFLAQLEETGNLTYCSESADDVTSQYLDLTARITTLTGQRDRLWELQETAEDLTDLLEIETALTDVLYQIESYQTQLNYLAEQVDYATIYLSIAEVIDYTITEPTLWETVQNTFTRGLHDFATTIGNILLWILSVWVWIGLAIVGVLVYHSTKRNHKRKHAKKDG